MLKPAQYIINNSPCDEWPSTLKDWCIYIEKVQQAHAPKKIEAWREIILLANEALT